MNLPDLKGLSFFVDDGLQSDKKYLSVTINKLKGLWKLSRTAETNVIVLPSSFFLSSPYINLN
jgi:hypothetical protein